MANDTPLTVGLVSLGCAKNLVDTQIMCGVLVTEGLELAHDPDHADIVLINTCAFIKPSRDEAAGIIDEMCAHKDRGGCLAVIVTGCLPQRYRERLLRRFPLVDAWLGIDQLEKVATIAHRAAATAAAHRASPTSSRTSDNPPPSPIMDVSARPTALFTPRLPQLALSNPSYAYLKVAEGCNHACAFCAIPAIRGCYRSRPVSALVEEARALLKDGRRELNIIAQDTTGYGREKRGGPRLTDLMQALDALRGKFWLRLLYGYPAHLTDDFLAVLAQSRHVVPYLDVPIQHSHPDILCAMRRADTIKALPGMTACLRAAIPGVAVRTTCLVGFPGETDDHFAHLLAYVREARFDHLGVFAFSPEEGTPAADLPDQVPEEVAAARRDELMRVQQKIAAARNRERIGQRTEVLLQHPVAGRRGKRDLLWIARTRWQAPEVDGETIVTGLTSAARFGDFAKVRLTGIRGYDLLAEVVCRR